MTHSLKTILDLANKPEEHIRSRLTIRDLELFKNFINKTDKLWQRFPDEQNRILEYANTNDTYVKYLKKL